MDPLRVILLLSIVQGITEFLPVSSSGHVILAQALLQKAGAVPMANAVELHVVLHLGTLLAVLLFYYRAIWRLVTQDRRVIFRLVVATLPAVGTGLTLKYQAPWLLESSAVVGLMLPITGLVLFWASRQEVGHLSYTELGYRQALLIGIWQAAAFLPGISRSGFTIAAGLSVGLRRESAAAFAFLLAIPVIVGASLLEGAEMYRRGSSETPWDILLLAGGASFFVGWGSLWWLISWINRDRLGYFAYWCIPLGVVVTIWQWWP